MAGARRHFAGRGLGAFVRDRCRKYIGSVIQTRLFAPYKPSRLISAAHPGPK